MDLLTIRYAYILLQVALLFMFNVMASAKGNGLKDYWSYHSTICVHVVSKSFPDTILISASCDYLHFHCGQSMSVSDFIKSVENEMVFEVSDDFYLSSSLYAIIPDMQMDSLFEYAGMTEIINRYFVYYDDGWILVVLRNRDGEPVVFYNNIFHTKKYDHYEDYTNFDYLFYKLQQRNMYVFLDPNLNLVLGAPINIPYEQRKIEVR